MDCTKTKWTHDWPKLREVKMWLVKGCHVTNGSMASEWNRLLVLMFGDSNYSMLSWFMALVFTTILLLPAVCEETRCNDTGLCIAFSDICDGECDCLDYSDEREEICNPRECHNILFFFRDSFIRKTKAGTIASQLPLLYETWFAKRKQSTTSTVSTRLVRCPLMCCPICCNKFTTYMYLNYTWMNIWPQVAHAHA